MDAAIARAVAALRRGGVIAYPTEAVWGLGCDPFNESAVRRIFALKQRPAGVGVIAHLHLLAEHGIALAAAVSLSTLLAMAAGAAAFVAVARLTGQSDDP